MKNIFKLFLLSFLVFAVSCENEDDPRFQDNPETGWIEFASGSTTVAVTSRTTTINIPVTFTAPINLSDVTVNYSINTVSGGAPSTVVTGLGTSITIVGNTNRANISLDPLPDAVQQLIDNGDSVFEISLTSANRGIGIGLADGSATTTHTVNLLCGGEPIPGDYVVDMADSFGDGWQTDDANGGSGITVTLTDVNGDETVIEVGMCSPYAAADGTFLRGPDCTGPASTSFFSATAIVTIPPGTVGAIWNFPGDWYGEISFDITNPNGTVLYSAGLNEPAGELAISYCI